MVATSELTKRDEALRLAVQELARMTLKPGESFEIHAAEGHVVQFARVPTADVLNEWGDFLAEHSDGDDPSEVLGCCGRCVVVLHEGGGELIALE